MSVTSMSENLGHLPTLEELETRLTDAMAMCLDASGSGIANTASLANCRRLANEILDATSLSPSSARPRQELMLLLKHGQLACEKLRQEGGKDQDTATAGPTAAGPA